MVTNVVKKRVHEQGVMLLELSAVIVLLLFFLFSILVYGRYLQDSMVAENISRVLADMASRTCRGAVPGQMTVCLQQSVEKVKVYIASEGIAADVVISVYETYDDPLNGPSITRSAVYPITGEFTFGTTTIPSYISPERIEGSSELMAAFQELEIAFVAETFAPASAKPSILSKIDILEEAVF